MPICLSIEAWFGLIPITNQVKTLYPICLRTEAWFGSIPVIDQVETLYPICLRTEAWFSSIPIIDQVETLYSYFSKDKNLVRFDPDHRPSGNLTFLF